MRIEKSNKNQKNDGTMGVYQLKNIIKINK